MRQRSKPSVGPKLFVGGCSRVLVDAASATFWKGSLIAERQRVSSCSSKSQPRVVGARAFSRSNMGPFETIYINETVAACDGDDEPHGHPRVFLNLGPDGKVECPYCSRLFVNRAMQRTDAADATTPPRVSEERNV